MRSPRGRSRRCCPRRHPRSHPSARRACRAACAAAAAVQAAAAAAAAERCSAAFCAFLTIPLTLSDKDPYQSSLGFPTRGSTVAPARFDKAGVEFYIPRAMKSIALVALLLFGCSETAACSRGPGSATPPTPTTTAAGSRVPGSAVAETGTAAPTGNAGPRRHDLLSISSGLLVVHEPKGVDSSLWTCSTATRSRTGASRRT